MGTYTSKVSIVAGRPRSKRVRESGGASVQLSPASQGGGSSDDPRLVRNDGADNAVKTIAVVTAYPATPDPNTLYILVSS